MRKGPFPGSCGGAVEHDKFEPGPEPLERLGLPSAHFAIVSDEADQETFQRNPSRVRLNSGLSGDSASKESAGPLLGKPGEKR